MLVLGFTVGAWVFIAKADCVAGDAYATNPCIKVLDPEIQESSLGRDIPGPCASLVERKHILWGLRWGRALEVFALSL